MTQDEDPFESAYRTQAPDGSVVAAAGWDTGEPQPVVVELERDGWIRGDVLDAGCGTGENALYVAERGYSVTGVDAAPSAIAHARAKADRRGIGVDFAVADVLDLAGYAGRFDTVIDSGVFHVFSDEDQARYLAALHTACRPDAVAYFLTFSDRQPGEWGPRRMTEREIRDSFGDGWVLAGLRRATMAADLPEEGRQDIRAWLATARLVSR
ncbi:MAG: class I SAM-dependent methyltransferase [Streptosporangiaceae bacterium]